MNIRLITIRCLWLIPGYLLAMSAGAFDFGNMMSPNKWFNDDRDRDDDYGDYYGPPAGYGYPNTYEPVPGYPARGYAEPGYAQPGYGAPGYPAPAYTPQGYGAPGYQTPAYAAPQAPAPATNSGGSAADAAEITRLKKRVRELEAERSGQASHWQLPQPDNAGTAYFPPPDEHVNKNGGKRIESWQAPMTPQPAPGHETSTEVTPPPAQERQATQSWTPSTGGYNMPAPDSPGTTPVQNSGHQNVPSEAERNAWQYKPPPQYQGQPSYDIGR